MPTYEYECEKCEERFELFQRITEPPRKRCPKCKGKVRRLVVSGAGLIFKGSGFYATDYRSENYKKGARKETSVPPSAKSETKPSAGKTSTAKKDAAK
jgi:putative FmdB family regulatory protein